MRQEKKSYDFSLILEFIHQPVFIHDAEFRVIYANNAYIKLAKRKKENILNNVYWESFPKRNIPLKRCLDSLKKNGETTERIRYNGKFYLSRSVPVHLHTSKQYSIHVFEDITAIEQEKMNRENVIVKLIGAMGLAVGKRDPYTSEHQHRVAYLAKAIAEEMKLPAKQIRGIYLGALMHDIGKLSIPADILSCPRKLSDAEFELIKIHPQAGFEIIQNIPFIWPIKDIILQHHERLDGSGYPNGLKGRKIILETRIVSVADVFESMSSHRPYRPKNPINKVIDELQNGAGKIYDATVVKACIKLVLEDKFIFPKDVTEPILLFQDDEDE